MDDKWGLDHWMVVFFKGLSAFLLLFGNLNYDFAGKVLLVVFRLRRSIVALFKNLGAKKQVNGVIESDRKFFQNWKVGSNRDDDCSGSNGCGCPF